MRRQRLVEPRRGGDRVEVVVGQRRFVKLTRKWRVAVAIRRACRPVPPAREAALRIGHRSDRVCESSPIAVPYGGSRPPLQRIVVEIGGRDRSEERRVGKECRARRTTEQEYTTSE